MSESHDERVRQVGTTSLAMCKRYHKHRHQYFENKLSQSNQGGQHGHGAQQGIVPNVLLQHICDAEGVDESIKASARKSIAVSQKIRDDRQATLAGTGADDASSEAFIRGVYDMQNRGDPDSETGLDDLPGEPVRLEGQPATQDKAVNEAYDNALIVLQFYEKNFNYKSLDGKNMPVISSVHFAQNMGNAFWTSEKQQMVYGDGDGEFLYNFTGTIDVIGHEMTVSIARGLPGGGAQLTWLAACCDRVQQQVAI